MIETIIVTMKPQAALRAAREEVRKPVQTFRNPPPANSDADNQVFVPKGLMKLSVATSAKVYRVVVTRIDIEPMANELADDFRFHAASRINESGTMYVTQNSSSGLHGPTMPGLSIPGSHTISPPQPMTVWLTRLPLQPPSR